MPQLERDPGLSPATALAAREQRQHQRHLCLEGGILRLAVRPAFRGQQAVLLDVSAGGIGLLLGEPLEVGAVLAFDLCLPQGPDPRGRLAYVRHCAPHPVPANAPWLPRRALVPRLLRRLVGLSVAPTEGRAWLVGCEFSRPLDPAELAESLRLLGLSKAEGKR